MPDYTSALNKLSNDLLELEYFINISNKQFTRSQQINIAAKLLELYRELGYLQRETPQSILISALKNKTLKTRSLLFFISTMSPDDLQRAHTQHDELLGKKKEFDYASINFQEKSQAYQGILNKLQDELPQHKEYKADIYTRLAQGFTLQEDYQLAVDFYLKYLTLSSELYNGHQDVFNIIEKLALVYRELGYEDKIKNLLIPIIKNNSAEKNPKLKLILAESFYFQGDCQSALTLYQSLTVKYNFAIAKCAAFAGDIRLGIRKCSVILENWDYYSHEQHLEILLLRATLFYFSGATEKANLDYTNYIKLTLIKPECLYEKKLRELFEFQLCQHTNNYFMNSPPAPTLQNLTDKNAKMLYQRKCQVFYANINNQKQNAKNIEVLYNSICDDISQYIQKPNHSEATLSILVAMCNKIKKHYIPNSQSLLLAKFSTFAHIASTINNSQATISFKFK